MPESLSDVNASCCVIILPHFPSLLIRAIVIIFIHSLYEIYDCNSTSSTHYISWNFMEATLASRFAIAIDRVPLSCRDRCSAILEIGVAFCRFSAIFRDRLYKRLWQWSHGWNAKTAGERSRALNSAQRAGVGRETSPDGNLFQWSENNKLSAGSSRSLLIRCDGNARAWNARQSYRYRRLTTYMYTVRWKVNRLFRWLRIINWLKK